MSIEQIVAAGAASAFSAAKLAGFALGGMVRALSHRSELEHLASLAPSQLRDIGLTPEDVGFANGLPPSRDPTAELARRAAEYGRL